MATAPVDIPVKVSGLSDLQKLERRMLALEKEVTRLQKATPKAASQVQNLGNKARGAAGGVRVLGAAFKSALGPIGLALAGIGSLTAAFRTLSAQDFSEAKVRTLGVDSEELRKKLIGLSAELEQSASVAELTGAAYDVASAGFNTAAQATDVLKAAQLGATGGFAELNTVANATTSALNAYGLSSREANRLVDQFIQTQNDGKIVVAQYADNIGKVASAAAGLGIPLAEVNAVIAQSTASGVQAETAFTGLKTALARLAGGEVTKALKEVGVSVTAASLKADGLVGTFEKLQNAGLDTGQIFKALGAEAAPALLPVLNNLERFKELTENQANSAGAAAKANAEAANTIQGQWTRLTNAVQNLFSDQSEAGIVLKEAISALADAVVLLGKTFRFLKELLRPAFELFGSFVVKTEGAYRAFGRAAGGAEDLADAIAFIGVRAVGAIPGLGQLVSLAERFNLIDIKGAVAAVTPASSNGIKTVNYQEAMQAAILAKQLADLQKGLVTAPTGGAGTAASSAAARAQKQEEEAAKRRLKTAQDLLFASQNRLRLAQELLPLERLEEEAAVKQLEIKRKFNDLLGEAKKAETVLALQQAEANELTAVQVKLQQDLKDLRDGATANLKDEIGLLTAKLAGKEEEYRIAKEIKALEEQGVQGAAGLVQQRESLKAQIEQVDALKASYEEMASVVSSALTGAFQEVVTGANTAEQALAKAFEGIAESFLSMALKMIEQWLVMQALGLLSTGASGGFGAGGGVQNGLGTLGPNFGIPQFANGGEPPIGRPSIVGEDGPELIVPGSASTVVPSDLFQATRDAIAGGSGDEVSEAFADNAAALGSSAMITKEKEIMREAAIQESRPLDVRYESTVINNVSYVSEEQFQRGIKSAVAQSKSAVFSDLKNKPSARAGIGLR